MGRPATDAPPNKRFRVGFSIPRGDGQPERIERGDRDNRERQQASNRANVKAKQPQGRAKDSTPSTSRDSGKRAKGKQNFSSEYFSPSCFAEAWSKFFSAKAIMLVTSIGLLISKIPSLLGFGTAK